MPTALIIDDDRDSREVLVQWFARNGFEAAAEGTLAEARKHLQGHSVDLVLLDLQLPDGNGLELLSEIEAQQPAQVALLTGHASVDSAVEAFRSGAVDYLTKPVDLGRLKLILRNVQQTLAMREAIHSLRGELRRLGRFGRIIGASPPMQQLYDMIERVAPTDSTVLVTGETGTGKDLAAETIHGLSARSSAPYLPINCGAVAPTLIESELFGHERGSFTGADRLRRGIFERAHGGTLFLDEITEMPPELQVKLLRVLETGAVTRIGGDKPHKVDVRLIAATNRDPKEAVAEGKLREDLLYRLLVFPLLLPPLRDRGDDIALLAGAFLEELNAANDTSKRISDAAIERLRRHAWPGNVRELKHVIERAYIMAGDLITADCLPTNGVESSSPQVNGLGIDVGMSIADAEKRLILATLEGVGGVKRRAAEVLGISLKTLYNRLNAYGGSGVE
jgi:DNA-binding NtrC family response regulator